MRSRHSRQLPAFAALAAVSLVVIVSGCAQSAPKTPPSIRGVVTEPATGGGTQGGAVLVVWSEELGVQKAEFDAAAIRLAKGGVVIVDRKKSTLDALERGDLVRAWFTGPVAESYPVQAGASRIEVVGSYDGELPTPGGLESPLEQPE